MACLAASAYEDGSVGGFASQAASASPQPHALLSSAKITNIYLILAVKTRGARVSASNSVKWHLTHVLLQCSRLGRPETLIRKYPLLMTIINHEITTYIMYKLYLVLILPYMSQLSCCWSCPATTLLVTPGKSSCVLSAWVFDLGGVVWRMFNCA